MSRENLELATAILAEIKARVTSSDDIIPSVECPIFSPVLLKEYTEKFSTNVLSRYITLTHHVIKVFDSLKAAIPECTALRGHPDFAIQFIANLATALMGAGDCGPTSSLACALLLQRDCRSPVSHVTVSGRKSNGLLYGHQFVIIGEHRLSRGTFGPLAGRASPFKSLGADCVILDPLINMAFRASDIDQLEKVTSLYRTFQIDTITDCLIINHNKSRAKPMMTQMHAAAERLRDDVYRQYHIAPYVKDSLEMPIAKFEHAIRCTIRIYDAATTDPRVMEYITSHTKHDILLTPEEVEIADRLISVPSAAPRPS